MSDRSGESDTDASLPRQSVVRRTTHMANIDDSRTHKLKPEDKLSEVESTSDDQVDDIPDNNGPLSLRISIPKAYSSGLLPNNHTDDGFINETKLVCHSASAFYNQTTRKRTTTGRCFYKDNESHGSDSSSYHGNSQRKAVRKAKHAYFSDESFEDSEVSVAAAKAKKKKKQGLGGYDSDSEFMVRRRAPACMHIHVRIHVM